MGGKGAVVFSQGGRARLEIPRANTRIHIALLPALYNAAKIPEVGNCSLCRNVGSVDMQC